MTGSGRLGMALSTAALAVVLIFGCAASRNRSASETESAGSGLARALREVGGAPAGLAVAEPMRPFFAVGLAFIALGGVVFCFGGKASGGLMLGLGVATTGTGVLFVQYPWVVLLSALAAGVLATVALCDRLRACRQLDRASSELRHHREALEAAAAVIQNLPEGKAIKMGLAGLGPEVEGKVRLVVDPIKEKLRREGKIAADASGT